MAIKVEVPPLGESVKQAILIKWHKPDGETVGMDEPLCELETDKANVDIPALAAGTLRHLKKEGDSVAVGEVIGRIDDSGAGIAPKTQSIAATANSASTSTKAQPPAGSPSSVLPEDLSPAVRALVMEHALDAKSIRGTGPNGRITVEDIQAHVAKGERDGNGKHDASDKMRNSSREAPAPEAAKPPTAKPQGAPSVMPDRRSNIATTPTKAPPALMDFDSNGVHRAPMSKIRKRIAQTLVDAQHNAAILTTFNEIDMTAVMDLRSRYKERFQEVHGIGLGFMSFFARAACLSLREFPRVNAFLEGDDVVYHNYVHLGIAVSTDRGLAVPVLRNVQEMSFARVENEIKRVATAVRDGKLGLEELSGGTFTITNGGVFGSLLSTPIINPPQSGILGMHAIVKRPVAVNDKVEIRSMMYVALSYDHRLVDGRESVSFLVRLKQLIEDPARLMLEI